MEQVIQDILNSRKLGTCPCCEQKVKLYKRQIYKQMVQFLLALSRHPSAKTSTLIEELGKPDGDFAKMRYWGLMEEVEVGEELHWRITDEGRAYLAGTKGVQQHVLLYNDTVMGFEGPVRLVSHAWKEVFDYSTI